MRKAFRLGLVLLMLLGGSGTALALESFKTAAMQSAAGATGNGTPIDTANYTSLALQVTITNTATVTFEGTVDGTNWYSAVCTLTSSTSATLVTSAANSGASGAYQCPVAGLAQFRARVSAFTNGTVTVTGRATTAVLGKKGGSGGSGTALTVAEEDGSPSVSSVDTITFPNGSLTDDGSGDVSVAGALPSALLDSTNHTDTVTGTVVRGDIMCGNSTPKWARVARGATGTMLYIDSSGDCQWGTVDTSATTFTFTNKTIDAEATGNVITLPKRVWLPAAGCNNATAGTIWDLPTSNPAVAACVTGTNTQKGVLEFADSASLSAQTTYLLPTTWTGTVDARIKWVTAATSGNIVWQLLTVCVADAETDDPSFSNTSTVTDAAKGTTLQTNDAAITTVTVTGCAAGELMHVKILRDSAHASDTLAATARLIGIELVIREAM